MSNNRTQPENRRFPAEGQEIADLPAAAVEFAGITPPPGLPEPYRLAHDRPFACMALNDGEDGHLYIPRQAFEAALNRWAGEIDESGTGAVINLHPTLILAIKEYVPCWLDVGAKDPSAMIVDRQWGHA